MPDKKMMVVVREITEVPADFLPVNAVPGTAGYEYIMGVSKLVDMIDDPRYIGSFIEPYGYLSIFADGSSLKTEIGGATN
jgi:hypothetical protein